LYTHPAGAVCSKSSRVIPCFRQISGTSLPASASFKIATIWLPVNHDAFMQNLLGLMVRENSTFEHRYFSGGLPFSPMPSSRATCAQLTPGCRACSTAPRLNSGLNFLRFDINTPFAHYQASLKCP